MLQTIFGLIQVIGMMFSKGKLVIGSNFVAKDKNIKDD
jgi:hypothetical protein